METTPTQRLQSPGQKRDLETSRRILFVKAQRSQHLPNLGITHSLRAREDIYQQPLARILNTVPYYGEKNPVHPALTQTDLYSPLEPTMPIPDAVKYQFIETLNALDEWGENTSSDAPEPRRGEVALFDRLRETLSQGSVEKVRQLKALIAQAINENYFKTNVRGASIQGGPNGNNWSLFGLLFSGKKVPEEIRGRHDALIKYSIQQAKAQNLVK